jgi:hypothetical protein
MACTYMCSYRHICMSADVEFLVYDREAYIVLLIGRNVGDFTDAPWYLMYHLELGLSLGHLHAFTRHHVNNWPAQQLKCFYIQDLKEFIFIYFYHIFPFFFNFAICFFNFLHCMHLYLAIDNTLLLCGLSLIINRYLCCRKN